VYPNGDSFEGTFNAELAKHGHGKYVWTKELGEEGPKNAWLPLNEEGDAPALPESRVIAFEGGYKDGLPHGIGRMTFPNGDAYHGAWEAGKQQGQGTYYYASGDLYSGQWTAGKKHGRGAYVYKADDSQLVRPRTARFVPRAPPRPSPRAHGARRSPERRPRRRMPPLSARSAPIPAAAPPPLPPRRSARGRTA